MCVCIHVWTTGYVCRIVDGLLTEICFEWGIARSKNCRVMFGNKTVNPRNQVAVVENFEPIDRYIDGDEWILIIKLYDYYLFIILINYCYNKIRWGLEIACMGTEKCVGVEGTLMVDCSSHWFQLINTHYIKQRCALQFGILSFNFHVAAVIYMQIYIKAC